MIIIKMTIVYIQTTMYAKKWASILCRIIIEM